MDKNLVRTCPNCNMVPTRQSAVRCPRCGTKLMLWDRSKDPIERKPDWPPKRKPEIVERKADHIDYAGICKVKEEPEEH